MASMTPPLQSLSNSSTEQLRGSRSGVEVRDHDLSMIRAAALRDAQGKSVCIADMELATNEVMTSAFALVMNSKVIRRNCEAPCLYT